MNTEQFELTDAERDLAGDEAAGNPGENSAGNPAGEDLAADAQGVGPGRPPEGRRFAKGISGNPKGRPKRGSGAKGDRLPGADEPTRRVILAEAYRMVTVKEGDTDLVMPAHAAVFRALTEKALKGSQIAQRRWTAMVREAEAEQKREQIAIYNLLEVEELEHELSFFHGRRMPVKSYADDILVDRSTGVAVVRGEE